MFRSEKIYRVLSAINIRIAFMAIDNTKLANSVAKLAADVGLLTTAVTALIAAHSDNSAQTAIDAAADVVSAANAKLEETTAAVTAVLPPPPAPPAEAAA